MVFYLINCASLSPFPKSDFKTKSHAEVQTEDLLSLLVISTFHASFIKFVNK